MMNNKSVQRNVVVVTTEDRPKCGIVMPISACDTCTEQHWSEVKSIIMDSVEQVGFSANLVSDADDVGIIQKRIIHNLYENPVVVCDVSGKNPNVMFELGMRLAFDKPTIIVKDDMTSYSFDTSPIEHLEYPRDLRFAKIVEFKKNLGEKVKATWNSAETNKNYTTFLKHFGTFSIARLETTEVSKEDYIIEELKELRHALSRRETISDYDRIRMSIDRNSVEAEKHMKSIAQSLLYGRINDSICAHDNRSQTVTPEFEGFIVNELLNDQELRSFFHSRREFENAIHSTIRQIVGARTNAGADNKN